MKAVKDFRYFKILGEYSTSGTRSITIENADYYKLEMVGAGGGGAHAGYNKYWRAGTGGSGAGFIGEIYLTAGTYIITVGAGGSEDYYYQGNSSRATNGGSTILSINDTPLITCGGGTGGSVIAATITIGTGGTLLVDSSVITRNVDLNKNGNNGNSSNHYGSYIATNGGLSVYDGTVAGYGAGGGTTTASEASPDAVSGYFKLYKEVESTDDYDYILEVYEVIKETIRNYYKYQYSSWTQPVLSDNGTIGGDSFSVSTTSVYTAGNDIYKGFDNNTDTYYAGAYDAKPIITMYNPLPLKITNIQVTNRISGTDSVEIRDYKINVSNDNINYTTILTGTNTDSSYGGVWNINLSSNTNAYKYYQIEVLSIGSVNYCEFAEIKITATQRVTGEGSSADYDFYKDVEVYKAVKF